MLKHAKWKIIHTPLWWFGWPQIYRVVLWMALLQLSSIHGPSIPTKALFQSLYLTHLLALIKFCQVKPVLHCMELKKTITTIFQLQSCMLIGCGSLYFCLICCVVISYGVHLINKYGVFSSSLGLFEFLKTWPKQNIFCTRQQNE